MLCRAVCGDWQREVGVEDHRMLSVPVQGRGERGDGEKGERACGSIWTCNYKPLVNPECEMPGISMWQNHIDKGT